MPIYILLTQEDKKIETNKKYILNFISINSNNYVYILTRFNEQGSKIDRTITFNDDNSIATYKYGDKTLELKKD